MMQIDDLIKALASGEHEEYPAATDADVAMTEEAIAKKLPSSYKRFVTTFSNGAYLFLLQEVSAVGKGNDQILPIQDIQTVKGDPEGSIPFREGGQTQFKDLIPFGLDHNGNAWCFLSNEMDSSGECPVAYLDCQGRKLYGRLDGFSSWLKILVDKEDEVIRTLYDDDVINNELSLG
jgi:hypothetical protein